MVTHAGKPKWPLLADGRAAGRHRDTGQRPVLPLLVREPVHGGPEETIRIVFPGREEWRRRGVRRLLNRIRQPVLAWIVAVAVLGGLALLGITGLGAKTAAHSPAPLLAMVPAPVAVPATTSSPSASRQRHRRRQTVTATRQRTPRQPGSATATAPASTPASHRPASPRGNTPAVLVRYFVNGVTGATFHGEIDVVNNGRQPVAGWQIVLALEGDEVTSVQNASGFDSNGILLMQPATSTEVVPPDGGTLRVFFAAQGPRTVPFACAFNGISCQ